jgi:hypothetical protein
VREAGGLWSMVDVSMLGLLLAFSLLTWGFIALSERV